ncbi:MAG: hypothetical protein J5I90_02105, partial [Caldilineales bacterium]|nr:hypothetical protein [Caldilineales bacterium]
MEAISIPSNARRPLSITVRAILALALALSSLALPAQFLPSVFAGDNDHPLQIQYQGACSDQAGLHVVAFGLGAEGTNFLDSNPTDASEPLNGYFVVSGIPLGATIEEAWLYWNGSDSGNTFDDDPSTFNPALNDGDPTVELGGTQVGNPTPSSFGGPAFVRTSEFSYGYQAEVTSIITGNGNYALTGIDNLNNYVNGAELIVVYSDPTTKPHLVGVASGLDVMIGSNAPLSGPGSKAVVYQFDPAQVSRTITVTVGLGGAGFGTIDNTLWYTTGVQANLPMTPTDTSIIGLPGATAVTNPFNGMNNQQAAGTGPNPVPGASGLDWDHYQFTVNIPAGNSWFAVQVQSDDNANPQQLEWMTSTMEMLLACPEYTITKTRTSPDFVQPGEPVTFEIEVANTGITDIITATLRDTYSTSYLTYGYSGSFSTPASDNNDNDSQIDWSTGQGIGPIPYGQSKTVTVRFTAAASTQAIVGPPADRTVNTATIVNLLDENGTPAPGDSDTDDVSITAPGVTVEKTLVIPADGSTAVNGQVQWNIRVTNSGDTTLTTVPLADTYSTTYLTYGYSGSFSSPASNDNTDDGALNWTDITGAGTLAPGAFIDVTVNMTAKASTQALVNDQTINTGTVTGATDENGDTAPSDSDTEPVEIGAPQVQVVKTLLLPVDGSTAVN